MDLKYLYDLKERVEIDRGNCFETLNKFEGRVDALDNVLNHIEKLIDEETMRLLKADMEDNNEANN